MKSVEETSVHINSIRLKGGKYSNGELIKLLDGFPYNRILPLIMRRHPNILGYSVVNKSIVFDTEHSININAIRLFIKEAREYQIENNKPRTLSLKAKQDIINKCLELYFNGNSYEVHKLYKKLYEKK